MIYIVIALAITSVASLVIFVAAAMNAGSNADDANEIYAQLAEDTRLAELLRGDRV